LKAGKNLSILIDTNIFLNLIRKEAAFIESSEELLKKVYEGELKGLAASIIFMEIRWVFHEKREYGKAEKAVSLIDEIVEIVPLDAEIAKEAIDLKIDRRLELLDSIHAASAIMKNATLVTRDKDLKRKVEDIVSVKTPDEILKK